MKMAKNNQLTKSEEKKLVRLLSRVKLPAPYPVFIVLCKSVPMVAVDIALMKDKNHLFLTYRNDEFYRGWHMPGSILIYHEKPIKTFYRAAKKELGLGPKNLTGVKFQNYFSQKDIRGNGITLLFTAHSAVKLKNGKYFCLDNLPEDFLKEQLMEIKALKQLR